MKLKGHEILGSAFNGKECIENIKAMKTMPDVVIMDHRMPIKSGLEAAKELKLIMPKLKIILLSADTKINEEAKLSGATSVLSKPVDIQKLLKTIEDLL